jgi:hypothetical protein
MRTFLGGVLGKVPRPSPAMVVALLALLIAASGAAVAAIPSQDGTITACRDNKTGTLRVINAEGGQTCSSRETQLAWKNGLAGSTVANADKLDNKDSTDFYAAGSKVADSEKLDGIDSSGFAAAYKRTVVVSPVGTDTQNGQALLDAITDITDASSSKPYLVHIEPATYDLGNGSLGMKPFVDIEGSGELNTVITSVVTDQGGCSQQPPGTVNGADDAEMRFLTVRNTGTTASGECHAAISNNSASPRLTHLTAQSTGEGNGQAIAVVDHNSSPTMIDVTATASGDSNEANLGVYNFDSNSIIKSSKLSAAGGIDCDFPICKEREGAGVALSFSGGRQKVALSQIDGRITFIKGPDPLEQGTLLCFNNYDRNMAAVSC